MTVGRVLLNDANEHGQFGWDRQQLKSTSGKIHVSHNRELEFAFKHTVRMSAAALEANEPSKTHSFK